MDITGASDPYVKIKLLDSKVIIFNAYYCKPTTSPARPPYKVVVKKILTMNKANGKRKG